MTTYPIIDGQTNACSSAALPDMSLSQQRTCTNNQLSQPSVASSTSSKASSIGSVTKQRTQINIPRKILRWYICETLGKGGFSWVKKGIDTVDGRVVALKFTTRSGKNWPSDQINKIENEINSLRTIKHKNVLKISAFHLNAKYPQNDGTVIPTALLVLEYMPGGELFDILYYTSALNENVARTYFHQLITGLEACHAANVCHRDLKPQNLLLNSKYQLKIADFGLAKVFDHGNDPLMYTYYTGTRGYQAPEILLEKPYSMACDIFACGVILFIMLAGYPPFEAATKSCKWYRPLTTGHARSFWKQHRGCGISASAKDLITRMIWYAPPKRISIRNIKKHRKWYVSKKIMSDNELFEELKKLQRLKEIKRKKASKKLSKEKYPSDVLRAVRSDKIADIYDCKREYAVLESAMSNVWSGNGIIIETHNFYDGDTVYKVADIVNAYVRSNRLDKEEDITSVVVNCVWDSKKRNIYCHQLLHQLLKSEMLMSNSAVKHICKEKDSFVRVIYSGTNIECEPPKWNKTQALTMKDIFTTVEPLLVLLFIQDWVFQLNGKTILNLREARMEVHLATHNFPAPVNIEISVYRHEEYECYLVKFRRLGGDALHFSRVLNRLTNGCGKVLNGLPDDIFTFTEEEEDEADDKFDAMFKTDAY